MPDPVEGPSDAMVERAAKAITQRANIRTMQPQRFSKRERDAWAEDFARAALEAAAPRLAERDVWVSSWEHGPMDVFNDEDSAKAWNVCRPRTLVWDRLADGVWLGHLADEPRKTAVRVHRRSLATSPERQMEAVVEAARNVEADYEGWDRITEAVDLMAQDPREPERYRQGYEALAARLRAFTAALAALTPKEGEE